MPESGMYRLTEAWFVRMHRRDAEPAVSELAMIEFAEELEEVALPEVGPSFILPRADYERAAEQTRRHLDSIFFTTLRRA